MFDRVLSLLHYGEDYASGVTEKREIQHTNAIALIAILVYSIYVFVYAALSDSSHVFRNSAIVVAAFIPFVFIPLTLNKWGKLRLARWAMGLNYPGVVLALICFGQGDYFNAHFYFLAFCTLHFTYFPLSQWRDIAVLSLLNLSLFVVSYLGLIPPHPDVYLVATPLTFTLGIVNILFSALITGGMFFVAEYRTVRSEAELETLSTMDSVTGLLNRHGFTARFEEERRRCQRSETIGALLFLDLNKFKALNDEYGHDAGDLILVEVGRRIKGCLRMTDVVARIGGDEFVALMCPAGDDDAAAIEQASATVRGVHQRLSEGYDIRINGASVHYQTSSSIGIATFDGASDPADVLRQADQAMYREKKARG